MLLPLTVVPVPGPGAEDVLVGEDGRVWTGTADGGLHVHDPADGSVTTVTTTGGRPLGLEWLPDGRLLVCDARRGLLAVDTRAGTVETLATEAEGRSLLVTNNAAVAADGTVWFTDSSAFHPVEDWRDDLIAHTRSGRLLRRAPDGAVETVVGGLAYANGVALTPSGDAVLVAETATRRICRVALRDGEPGPVTTWVADLPGHPDNIALGSDGLVWVTVASPTDRVLRLLQRGPEALRRLALRAPERLKPEPKRTARVLALREDATVVHDLRFDATRWHLATGVREHRGRVWLGSLLEPAIAVGQVPGAQDAFVDDAGPALGGLARHLSPSGPVPVGEAGVALRLGVDLGEDDAVRVRQRLGVDLRPARDVHLVGRSGEGQRLGEGVRDLHARVVPVAVAGEDDGAPARQGPAHALEGPSSHDEGVAHRRGLEAAQLVGQVPRHPAVAPDDAVAGDGRDEADPGHTAIGALIEGWAS